MSPDAPDSSGSRTLKSDTMGAIVLLGEGPGRRIRREPGRAGRGLRWIARLVAANERRALQRLDGIAGLPQLLATASDGALERSYLAGAPMCEAGVADPCYFPRAHRLLHQLHRRGVAHNDLAKEANWLVDEGGGPAILDFQLAWYSPRRSRFFRLLCREDLRHLLKHKRTYFPERLTPTERRLLARPSWLQRMWFATGKRVYRFITRRLLRWEDNEGRGRY